MIKKINLARLTAAEFFQFISLILNTADAANPTTSKIKAAKADNADTAALQKCIDDMNATIVQYRQLILATQARKKSDPTPEEKK